MHGRQVAAHGADRERPGYVTQEETLKVTRTINRALCSQLNASQPLTTTTRGIRPDAIMPWPLRSARGLVAHEQRMVR